MSITLRKPTRAVGTDGDLIYAGPILHMDADTVTVRPVTITGVGTGYSYPAGDYDVELPVGECDFYDWA